MQERINPSLAPEDNVPRRRRHRREPGEGPAPLRNLNPEQRAGVEATEGPVLIVAGPGSGKTRVITSRAAHIVSTGLAKAGQVACMTFTNRAAREMRSRIENTIGGDAAGMSVGTFHRYCNAILKRHAEEAKLDRDFTVWDSEDQTTALRRSMTLAEVDAREFNPGRIKGAISGAKARLMTPAQLAEEATLNPFDDNYELVMAAAKVYEVYEDQLRRNRALDFDDLIVKAVEVMENSPGARRTEQTRLTHLMIDEFQDTNLAQYRLSRLLAGGLQNICVVGDPDQSIYGWRHATIENILNFREDYPECRVINLGRNYRSTRQIVDAASELIAHNRQRIDNPLEAMGGDGPTPEILDADDAVEEAALITKRMQQLVHDGHVRWRDCAVMYRTHRQSRAVEQACVQGRIPHEVVGGIRFFERKEIKDVIGYLRVLHNPSDSVAMQRVINTPPRDIGARTVDRLLGWAEANDATMRYAVRCVAEPMTNLHRPELGTRQIKAVARFNEVLGQLERAAQQVTLGEMVDVIIRTTGMEAYVKADEQGAERWDNVVELREWMREQTTGEPCMNGNLASVLDQVAMVADRRRGQQAREAGGADENDALTLITLHQAKGLEFEAVAICGVEEGTLPAYYSGDTEEERRLCYVGITRAKRHLLLSWTGWRHNNEAQPSRFLDEMESVLWPDEREEEMILR